MMRSRIRSFVRRLRSAPVVGSVVRAADRLWWARTILRSPLVDAEYYAAQRGRRSLARWSAVAHYVVRGFRRGMSLNPLFDELVAGGELPEVFRVPALYAYLVSERDNVTVHPWWDAVAFGAHLVDARLPPLERVWSDHSTVLTLQAGGRSVETSVREIRNAAIAAAREWSAASRHPRGRLKPGGALLLVRVVQSSDRRYHRKIEQIARRVSSDGVRAVVSLVDPDASQWVSATVLRLIMPAVSVRGHRRGESWADVVCAGTESATASTLLVMDARAEFADSEIDALVAEANTGAIVSPAHRRRDGTLQGVGAATIGFGSPYRLLERHPQEDLDTVATDVLDVPLLTGRTFAVSRVMFDLAGGIDRELVNDGELEALSAASRRVDSDVRIRVLTSIRPVLDEPDVAFALRSARTNVRSLTAMGLADATSEAEAIITAAGFRVLGWETRSDGSAPVPRLEWVRSHAGATRWALKTCAPAGRQGEVWGDTHFAQGLASALRRRGHTVVIDAFDARSRPTNYLDDVSVVIRGPYRIDPPRTGVRLQWIISHPDEITRREVAQFDRVYAASRRWSANATKRWGVQITPMLECTDTDLFRPRGLPRSDDIVFVGTARGIPRPSVVVPLNAGVPVRVYGPDWRPFIPQSAVVARSIAHADLAERYETASVVLNDQWPAMRREGFMAMRPFDVVAVGGRVVSEDVDDIVDLFEGAVVTYRDADHLVALLREDPARIFPSDAELARISERIRAEHSFDARAAVLDEAARDARPTSAK